MIASAPEPQHPGLGLSDPVGLDHHRLLVEIRRSICPIDFGRMCLVG
jgi:hypothetical protein